MTATSTLNILQRLNRVMKDVSYIQKERKAGMRYSIVSHDAVTAKVRPLLVEHGIVYFPVRVDRKQNGNRTEVDMTVRFTNIDQCDFIDVQTAGYGIDDSDKGVGKAISYAVKYALLKALGLETGDDPDIEQDVQHQPPVMVAASGTPGASKTASRPSFDKMVKDIRNAASINGLKAWYKENITEIDALPPDFLDELRVEYNDRLIELKAQVAS